MQLLPSGPDDYAQLRQGGDWRGYRLPPGGLEPDEVLAMLTGWSARLQAAQGWGSWLAVDGGEVVASLAVKDPVQDGQVEIGYGVAPARRGRGVATRALSLVLAELAGRGLQAVLAETSPDNPASGRVLEKCGFQICGQRNSAEDGALILWRRVL